MSKQVPWLGIKYLPKVSWSFMICLAVVNFLKIRFFWAAMLFVFGRARRDSACSLSATSTLLNKDSVQQKVRADSLPHVVCLKCDPNGVTGFLGGGLDTSEQINHISIVKTNLQYTVCTCIVIFNTTCPSCIVKKLTGPGGGEVLIESILCICKAWCYLKQNKALWTCISCLSHGSGLRLRQDGTGIQQEADAEWKHGNWEGLGHVHNWKVSIRLICCVCEVQNVFYVSHANLQKSIRE